MQDRQQVPGGPAPYPDDLPALPDGYAYLTDDAGNYLTDDAGNYLIVPI